MTIEEIIYGESKNIEFKKILPKDSVKYVKTIIAFANTQGGTIIVGVDDKTREATGVDRDSAFQIMDSIANAVADSCMPQIIPNIELQTIGGRTIIVITVAPEANRPYYLKSKGKENGTYIRLAGTTRLAGPEKIKELEMEGAHISWDELTCVGFEVTEKAVKKLCQDIMRYREEVGLPERKVTATQLINWKILKSGETSLVASNAFALLTSDYFPYSKTQCAVFRGTERTVFLDKREYTGSVYEQIEQAVAFVLRNIQLRAAIDGLVRKETYELPVEAIREMIINAHCHRNLIEASSVQVAVYDDRLEVTSPGGLYNGLTYEEIMQGHSKLRNRAIANIFNQMGLVEAWGTGIRRIVEAAERYRLPAPEIQAFDNMFRVNLYRNSQVNVCNDNDILWPVQQERNKKEVRRKKFGESSEKTIIGLNETQRKILELIQQDNRISAKIIAQTLYISSRSVEKNIKVLKDYGFLMRHGSPKGGYWEIIKD